MNRRQGLSLIEVIISALILTLTVGGILYIFSAQKKVVARTGRQIQAMNFARQTLEKLRNEVSAQTWPDGGLLGTTGVAITEALPAGDFKANFGADRNYVVTNMDADDTFDSDDDGTDDNDVDYKKVTVTVCWEEPEE